MTSESQPRAFSLPLHGSSLPAHSTECPAGLQHERSIAAPEGGPFLILRNEKVISFLDLAAYILIASASLPNFNLLERGAVEDGHISM